MGNTHPCSTDYCYCSRTVTHTTGMHSRLQNVNVKLNKKLFPSKDTSLPHLETLRWFRFSSHHQMSAPDRGGVPYPRLPNMGGGQQV